MQFPDYLSPLLRAVGKRVGAAAVKFWTGVSTVQHIEDRASLAQIYTPRETFHGDGNTYCLWLSGTGVLSPLRPGKVNINRLVLPHPECRFVGRMTERDHHRNNYPCLIRDMTKRARDYLGIDVRRYREFDGHTLTIRNPHHRCGWLRMEKIEPATPPGENDIIHMTRAGHVPEFRQYWRVFVDIWRNSEEVSP